jgi:hypothetical protein
MYLQCPLLWYAMDPLSTTTIVSTNKITNVQQCATTHFAKATLKSCLILHLKRARQPQWYEFVNIHTILTNPLTFELRDHTRRAIPTQPKGHCHTNALPIHVDQNTELAGRQEHWFLSCMKSIKMKHTIPMENAQDMLCIPTLLGVTLRNHLSLL